ncbi:hypothetical protein PAMA_014540 [Pampus argenteus]
MPFGVTFPPILDPRVKVYLEEQERKITKSLAKNKTKLLTCPQNRRPEIKRTIENLCVILDHLQVRKSTELHGPTKDEQRREISNLKSQLQACQIQQKESNHKEKVNAKIIRNLKKQLHQSYVRLLKYTGKGQSIRNSQSQQLEKAECTSAAGVSVQSATESPKDASELPESTEEMEKHACDIQPSQQQDQQTEPVIEEKLKVQKAQELVPAAETNGSVQSTDMPVSELQQTAPEEMEKHACDIQPSQQQDQQTEPVIEEKLKVQKAQELVPAAETNGSVQSTDMPVSELQQTAPDEEEIEPQPEHSGENFCFNNLVKKEMDRQNKEISELRDSMKKMEDYLEIMQRRDQPSQQQDQQTEPVIEEKLKVQKAQELVPAAETNGSVQSTDMPVSELQQTAPDEEEIEPQPEHSGENFCFNNLVKKEMDRQNKEISELRDSMKKMEDYLEILQRRDQVKLEKKRNWFLRMFCVSIKDTGEGLSIRNSQSQLLSQACFSISSVDSGSSDIQPSQQQDQQSEPVIEEKLKVQEAQELRGSSGVPWPAIWTEIQGLRLSPGLPRLPTPYAQGPGTKLIVLPSPFPSLPPLSSPPSSSSCLLSLFFVHLPSNLAGCDSNVRPPGKGSCWSATGAAAQQDQQTEPVIEEKLKVQKAQELVPAAETNGSVQSTDMPVSELQQTAPDEEEIEPQPEHSGENFFFNNLVKKEMDRQNKEISELRDSMKKMEDYLEILQRRDQVKLEKKRNWFLRMFCVSIKVRKSTELHGPKKDELRQEISNLKSQLQACQIQQKESNHKEKVNAKIIRNLKKQLHQSYVRLLKYTGEGLSIRNRQSQQLEKAECTSAAGVSVQSATESPKDASELPESTEEMEKHACDIQPSQQQDQQTEPVIEEKLKVQKAQELVPAAETNGSVQSTDMPVSELQQTAPEEMEKHACDIQPSQQQDQQTEPVIEEKLKVQKAQELVPAAETNGSVQSTDMPVSELQQTAPEEMEKHACDIQPSQQQDQQTEPVIEEKLKVQKAQELVPAAETNGSVQSTDMPVSVPQQTAPEEMEKHACDIQPSQQQDQQTEPVIEEKLKVQKAQELVPAAETNGSVQSTDMPVSELQQTAPEEMEKHACDIQPSQQQDQQTEPVIEEKLKVQKAQELVPAAETNGSVQSTDMPVSELQQTAPDEEEIEPQPEHSGENFCFNNLVKKEMDRRDKEISELRDSMKKMEDYLEILQRRDQVKLEKKRNWLLRMFCVSIKVKP